MLSLLEKTERCSQHTKEEWWQAEAPEIFTDVHSLAEFNEVLKATQKQNTLLCVEFYKQDCVACRMMYPKENFPYFKLSKS